MTVRAALPALMLLLAAAGPPPERPGAERPAMVPGRDAILGYHLVPATGEAIDVRVVVRAGGMALRVDLPDHTYLIAAPGPRSLTMVVPAERTTVELPWSDGPQSLFLLDERARFTRKGEATIAGQKCSEYDVVLEKARSTVCVTPAGLVLRSQSQDPLGRRNLVEAFVVRYQSLPDLELTVPAEFDRLVPSVLEPAK